MERKRMSNYDLALVKAQKEFIQYNIAPMVRKYGLRQDSHYTYITFLSNNYRISRESGCVERLSEAGVSVPADFSESMTIYDVLAYAKENATLSGQYASVMHLKGVAKSANPGGNMFEKYAKSFKGRSAELREACEGLSGVFYPVGELAYRIPLFDFLSVVLQFWDADEEFDPALIIKWDDNTLDFMHFETTFYAAGCLLQRIADAIDKQHA